MSKKRKTRQQKIVLQLKKQLEQKKLVSSPIETEFKTSQEEVFIMPKIEIKKEKVEKITDTSANFGDLKLIKKDLVKTLLITVLIIGLEAVLYLKLR
jgi:hypothetical protein